MVKHPTVGVVDQAEIDGRVIEVSKEFLPSMAIGYKNPKVNVFVEDGIKFMEKHKNKYDVIITDSSDPVGQFVRRILMTAFVEVTLTLHNHFRTG